MHVLFQLIILIDDDIGLTHRADLMLRMDHGIMHFFSMALFSAFLRFELVTIWNHLGQVVPDAGHSANEPGITAELVAANEKLKNIIKNGPWKEVDQAHTNKFLE
jgi:hypothetical protein